MTYRDDVDALYLRAQALQREVDRLRDQLEEARRSQPRRPTSSEDLRASVTGQRRLVWLPPPFSGPGEVSISLPARGFAADSDGPSDPDDLGLLVARLTAIEHALVVRLLELLTTDDFRAAEVSRRRRVFDQLVVELRARLSIPD